MTRSTARGTEVSSVESATADSTGEAPADQPPAKTNETTDEARPAYVAATLAYVRTPSGVVEVAKGDSIPADADEAHLAALAAGGAVVDPADATDDTKD